MKNRVFFWLLISILYIKNTNNGKPLVIMMVIKMVIMVNLGQISKAPPVTRRSSMTILYQIKNAMHAWLICLRHWIIYSTYVARANSTHSALLSAIRVMVRCSMVRAFHQTSEGSTSVWGSETVFWVCDKAWVANSLPSMITFRKADFFQVLHHLSKSSDT